MAIKSKLIVNETYQVYINGDNDLSIDDESSEFTVDIKDVPDLLKAIQMVMDEHTGSSEPNKK